MLKTNPTELLDVTFRESYTFGTSLGITSVAVGTSSDGEVVLTLGPPAADVLARVIARLVPSMSHPDATVDVDPEVWSNVVVDLFAAKALCGPMPEPAMVSGYLSPKGRRS